MHTLIESSMQVVDNAKEKEPLIQLIKLNKTWTKQVVKDPTLKKIALNYLPVLAQAT